MEKEIDQEVMDMCNFRDFIEQRGIEEDTVTTVSSINMMRSE